MKTYFVGLILLFMSISSLADEQYALVGYECNLNKNELVLTYKIAYNDAGRKMIKNKKHNQWEPDSLIIMRDDNNIERLKIIQKQCKLADGLYQVTISPEPGNINLLGECGAFVSASVEVRKDNKSILKRQFDNTCKDINSPIIKKIVMKSKTPYPQITTAPWDSFYN